LGNLFGTVDFQPFGLNLTSTQGKNEGIRLDFNNASVQYFLGIFALQANHGEKNASPLSSDANFWWTRKQRRLLLSNLR